MTEEQTSTIVKIAKSAKQEAPPAFSERCALRVKNHKFAPNSNAKPMITVELELIGYFSPGGELTNTIERSGVKYILGGLDVRSMYFTLEGGGLERYAGFWNLMHPGEELTELDTNNPDREYLTGLVFQAIVSSRMEPYRRQITEEEKAELKAQGKQPVGDPIKGEDGKPIELRTLNVGRVLCKHTGDLPEEETPY
jgi:hypothetical protein